MECLDCRSTCIFLVFSKFQFILSFVNGKIRFNIPLRIVRVVEITEEIVLGAEF